MGCLINAPIDVDIIWDGSTVFWRHAGAADWHPVERVHLPGLRGLWLLEVPGMTSLGSPPAFLDAPMNEPGYLQIWSGLFARTPQDWHLWVRGPVNTPRPAAYQVLEGVIQTDWWFGPLVTQIRFLATDRAIHLRRTQPMFQVIPVPAATTELAPALSTAFRRGLSEFGSGEWSSYERSMARRNDPTVRPGSYQREVHDRRRRSKIQSDEDPSTRGTQ